MLTHQQRHHKESAPIPTPYTTMPRTASPYNAPPRWGAAVQPICPGSGAAASRLSYHCLSGSESSGSCQSVRSRRRRRRNSQFPASMPRRSMKRAIRNPPPAPWAAPVEPCGSADRWETRCNPPAASGYPTTQGEAPAWGSYTYPGQCSTACRNTGQRLAARKR